MALRSDSTPVSCAIMLLRLDRSCERPSFWLASESSEHRQSRALCASSIEVRVTILGHLDADCRSDYRVGIHIGLLNRASMPSRIFLASALFGVIPFVLGFYFLAHARSFTALLGAPWPATARLGERPFRAYTSALGVRDFGLGVAHLSLALTGDAYGTALSFAGAIIFLLVGDFLVLSGYVVPHAYSTLSKTAIGLLHLPFTPIFAYAIARLVRRPRPPYFEPLLSV